MGLLRGGLISGGMALSPARDHLARDRRSFSTTFLPKATKAGWHHPQAEGWPRALVALAEIFRFS